MRRFKFLSALCVALLLISTLPAVQAQGPLDPFSYRWEQIDGKFDNPLFVTHAGDGSGRLFVVEQGGLIWILRHDVLLPEPFLDIFDLITDDVMKAGYTERGLIGLAFHPNYKENGLFFVYNTNSEGNSEIARYRVSADNPDKADPASRTVILTQQQPYPDHNGGMLAFGPDGYLYIAFGDGGGTQGDPSGNGQNRGVLLGKILRIDVDKTDEAAGKLYAIPPTNPFVDDPSAAPEVWAFGLRNPWRFSFDRLTGDLWIGDVGWGTREEINFQPASSKGGENYGWNIWEGTFRVWPDKPEPPDVVWPVVEYDHLAGCSVTGGYVYRGYDLPSLRGVYFYGDYCNGWVWALYRDRSGSAEQGNRWQNMVFKRTGRQISSFGEDERGELYLVDYKGYVLRLKRS